MSEDGPNRALLRFAVALEGATLLILVLAAVPLKRVFDVAEATQIMGPVHGLAFLLFAYALVEALSARAIGALGAVRLFLGAMVPFGGLVNERWLAKKARRGRR